MLVMGLFDIPLILQLHSIHQFTNLSHLASKLPYICAAAVATVTAVANDTTIIVAVTAVAATSVAAVVSLTLFFFMFLSNYLISRPA